MVACTKTVLSRQYGNRYTALPSNTVSAPSDTHVLSCHTLGDSAHTLGFQLPVMKTPLWQVAKQLPFLQALWTENNSNNISGYHIWLQRTIWSGMCLLSQGQDMDPFDHILTIYGQISVSFAAADFSDTCICAAECWEVISAIGGCTALLETLLLTKNDSPCPGPSWPLQQSRVFSAQK